MVYGFGRPISGEGGGIASEAVFFFFWVLHLTLGSYSSSSGNWVISGSENTAMWKVYLVPYPPSPECSNYSETVHRSAQIGLTAYLVVKSNAILLAGSFGRFNASGLPEVRSSKGQVIRRTDLRVG